ncbi:MAG: hypothetical protein E6Q83_19755 [Thiothrix sp.]|nr:MAG: hypothetical protein E6Q83_19755 [Thiothrix sp.]
MKQIINGKLYSTDSAQAVGYWDNGQEDDEFMAESVYRANSGDYFLWTTDNPAGEDELRLLNQDAAMDWLWRRDWKDADIAKALAIELA